MVVPGAEVFTADDHVPLIPFVEVVGNIGAVAFWQILSIASKAGVTRSVTVIVRVVVVAHWPGFGVNVYVADVVLSIVAGLHVPVILLVDMSGKVGAAAPEQIGAIASNTGIMVVVTVMFKVAVVAHWLALGVNV